MVLTKVENGAAAALARLVFDAWLAQCLLARATKKLPQLLNKNSHCTLSCQKGGF